MLDRRPGSENFSSERIVPLHLESPLLNLRQNVAESRYEQSADQLADLPLLEGGGSTFINAQTKFDRASVLESMPEDFESFGTWFTTFEQSFCDALEECEADTDRLGREWRKIQATRAHTDLLVNALHNELKPLPSLVLLQELFLAILTSPTYIQLRASERVQAAMIGLIRRAIPLGINLIDSSAAESQSSSTDHVDDGERG